MNKENTTNTTTKMETKKTKETTSTNLVKNEYMQEAGKMIEQALKKDKTSEKESEKENASEKPLESEKPIVHQPTSIKTKMEIEFEKFEKEKGAISPYNNGENGVYLPNATNDVTLNNDMNFNLIPNVNGKELLSDNMEEIPKLIDPIFHRVGLAALIGSSDTGKSSLLRDLCVSVVTGKKFLNWEVNPVHRRAYYVSTEDDKMAISYLLKKQNIDYKLKAEDVENLIYIFETDQLLNRLEAELSTKPADLVVIDAFADVYTGQLYETNRVRAFLNNFSQLAQKYGCLVIFLHHTNKRSDSLEPSKHNALGSQGFEAKMRLMIELKTDNQFVNKKHFCIVKGNYLSHKFKTHSYEVQFTDNLTFKNLETRTHYELLTQTKERRETIEYEYDEIQKLKSQGLTHEEIALELGISSSTVSRKLTRYKKILALEESSAK